jgi:hypothetical protein
MEADLFRHQPHYFRTEHTSRQKKFWNTAPQESKRYILFLLSQSLWPWKLSIVKHAITRRYRYEIMWNCDDILMGKLTNSCSEHTLVRCNYLLQESPRMLIRTFVLNLLITGGLTCSLGQWWYITEYCNYKMCNISWVRADVFTAVVMKVHVFGHVMLCELVNSSISPWRQR